MTEGAQPGIVDQHLYLNPASGDLLDLNHDVFASNPVMSEDIRQLLQSGSQLAPERRLTTLVPKDSGAGTSRYWSYEPLAVVRR